MDTSLQLQSLTALRVLVADDKPFIRNILQGMLLRLKVKGVIQAASGEQAIRLLRKYTHRIGCIISDWNMDPVGGHELLRTVRAGQIVGLPAATPFIMLTGHAGEDVVKTALALDVSAYLVKPVSFEKLVKTLESALTRKIRLRQSLYYRSIVNVEVPGAVKSTDRRAPQWVTWIAKSPKRADFEERLNQIRREAAHLRNRTANDDDEDGGIEIKNMRRIPIAEIQPGCVIAEDVYANDRDLLVAAGTVLSGNLLSRLRELAAGAREDAKLWVGDT